MKFKSSAVLNFWVILKVVSSIEVAEVKMNFFPKMDSNWGSSDIGTFEISDLNPFVNSLRMKSLALASTIYGCACAIWTLD